MPITCAKTIATNSLSYSNNYLRNRRHISDSNASTTQFVRDSCLCAYPYLQQPISFHPFPPSGLSRQQGPEHSSHPKAYDHPDGGLHHGTARIACGIVAGNAWDGYFAVTPEGPRIQLGPDELLRVGVDYFFHVPQPIPERLQ